MRREWTPEDLIASWTLVKDDWRLVGNKTGATRLGFALLLKFFELEGRFARHAGELPRQAVDYLAQQLRVAPDCSLRRWSSPPRAGSSGPPDRRGGEGATEIDGLPLSEALI
jgi:Domain of unknown function (DUF4158)